MTKIAFIGFGEAAQAMAGGLSQEASKPQLSAYDIRFADVAQAGPLQEKAKAHGVATSTSMAEAIKGADIVLSLVVGSVAVKVGEEAGRALTADQIFVDLNSISPDAKKQVAQAIAQYSTAGFVEGVVMARVPPLKHKVPILLAGSRAEQAASRMNEAGMDIEVAGDQIGQACAVKMIRSIVVKGVEALLIESLTAAEIAGVRERILDSIAGTFPGIDWRKTATYHIGRTQQHGKRRVTEMNEAAATVESLGLEPVLSRAIAKTIDDAHERFTASGFEFDRPYEDMLAVLAKGSTKEAAQ